MKGPDVWGGSSNKARRRGVRSLTSISMRAVARVHLLTMSNAERAGLTLRI